MISVVPTLIKVWKYFINGGLFIGFYYHALMLQDDRNQRQDTGPFTKFLVMVCDYLFFPYETLVPLVCVVVAILSEPVQPASASFSLKTSLSASLLLFLCVL